MRRSVLLFVVLTCAARISLAEDAAPAVSPRASDEPADVVRVQPPGAALLSDRHTLNRATAGFVAGGVLGTGGIAVGSLAYLGRGGSPWPVLLAAPLSALLQYGLGRLFDVPVTALSATEGMVLGVASAGLGYLLGTLAGRALGSDNFDETSAGAIGLVVGGAIGTPLWTLTDPVGFATPKSPPAGAAGDTPVFRAVADEAPNR